MKYREARSLINELISNSNPHPCYLSHGFHSTKEVALKNKKSGLLSLVWEHSDSVNRRFYSYKEGRKQFYEMAIFKEGGLLLSEDVIGFATRKELVDDLVKYLQ